MVKLTKEYVRKMVTTNEVWARHAILALYQRQTGDEQSVGATKHDNKMGFNRTDSGILSSFAQQLQAGRSLSSKQLTIAYSKLGKYSSQLLSIASGGEQ
jgi:hypothetical protein